MNACLRSVALSFPLRMRFGRNSFSWKISILNLLSPRFGALGIRILRTPSRGYTTTHLPSHPETHWQASLLATRIRVSLVYRMPHFRSAQARRGSSLEPYQQALAIQYKYQCTHHVNNCGEAQASFTIQVDS